MAKNSPGKGKSGGKGKTAPPSVPMSPPEKPTVVAAEKPKGRGGARPGAGRKPTPIEGVVIDHKAIAEAGADAAAAAAAISLVDEAEVNALLAQNGEVTDQQKGTLATMARVYGPAAIRTIVRNLKSKSDIARQRAADSLLDRGFGKPAQTMDLKADLSVTTNLADRVARAKARAGKK